MAAEVSPPPERHRAAGRWTIASFGSVVVNGIHYETNAATITVDGQPATQSDLRVGQVVSMVAELEDGAASGTASSVSFDDNVEGPIQSIDTASGVLVVLGQTVRIGTSTSFDDSILPRSLDGLAVGDFVEASGLVKADGASCDLHRDEGGRRFEVHASSPRSILPTCAQPERGRGTRAPSSTISGRDDCGRQPVGPRARRLTPTALMAGQYGFARHRRPDGLAEIGSSPLRPARISTCPACASPARNHVRGGTAADLGLDVKVEVRNIRRRRLRPKVDIGLVPQVRDGAHRPSTSRTTPGAAWAFPWTLTR
jgi:hypothetical protein